jgi:hypothetical protein
VAAAICNGVRGGGARLAFHVQAGNYDTDRLIDVLEGLRTFSAGRRPPCCGTGCRRTQRRDAGMAEHAAVAASRGVVEMRRRREPQ